MKGFSLIILFAILAAISLNTTSCKKAVLFSNANLSFSTDTIVFDTVFTTIGSTTQQLKIYNNDKRTLNIEQIELMGGSNSPFRINVDGLSGTNFADLDLEGEDSLFVFVEVTLDVNGGTLPMIVEDSIRFRTNGTDQYVNLAVWGQDAYFHYKESVSGTWPNDKPHVVYDYVVVDSAQTLNIQSGTDIYLHKGGILYNRKGVLNIQGTATFPVTLQGDRLEASYDDVSGQYYGIYFQQALPSTINYAVIKNGTSGVHLYSEDAGNTDYTLKMSNTIIQNCASYGVFLFQGARVKAENCLISKNGTHSLIVLGGGDFNFNHCHLVGYGNGENPGSAVGISNYYVNSGVAEYSDIDEGTITNSVIYGYQNYEFAIDTISQGVKTFTFEYNLIKSQDQLTGPFSDNIWNQDPLFTDLETYDFKFPSNSPLRDNGSNSFPNTIIDAFGIDIEGTPRNVPVDIGCYELY